MSLDERRARSEYCDQYLVELFSSALHQHPAITQAGVAIAAVGGYGRGQLFPQSDIDIVFLVQGHGEEIQSWVNSILYPLWDKKFKVDYSVRTIEETLEVFQSDIKVLLGLLDIRHLAGNSSLVAQVGDAAHQYWRKSLPTKVAEIKELIRQQHHHSGDLAYLLEPDIKESRGGLRDITLLRGLALSDHVELSQEKIDQSSVVLENVREVLHNLGGKDKLFLQMQDEVAERLNYASADALMSEVSHAARTIDYLLRIGLDQVEHQHSGIFSRFLPSKKPTEIAKSVFFSGRDVFLADGFDLDLDPIAPLRCAALAAQRGLTISRASAATIAYQLSTGKGILPTPWPDEARENLISLIGAGPAMVEVFETLEQEEILFFYLPEWRQVRSLPQRNALHRHTVDRHMVETAICAASYARKVKRPDLLFIAALLHDIGKGSEEDHSERGAELIAGIAHRLGFDASDVATLQMLVRHHLLLPATATRRDLDDPATIAAVAELVPENLELLHYLSFADGEATGKAAWSTWKARLVEDLVRRVKLLQAGAPVEAEPIVEHLADVKALTVSVDGSPEMMVVTIASPDRPGLLSIVAGALSNLRLDVRSARTKTVGSIAYMRWVVIADSQSQTPKAHDIQELIEKSLQGTFDLAQRIEERKRAYAQVPSIAVPAPVVAILEDAATDASIIEVRSHDRPALLFTIGDAITQCRVDIRSAIVTTLGSEAIDTLYVTEIHGGALSPERAEQVRQRIETLL